MLVQSLPSVQWATMRTWAAERGLTTLVSILDSVEDLRAGHPALSATLWLTATELAAKTGYEGHL